MKFTQKMKNNFIKSIRFLAIGLVGAIVVACGDTNNKYANEVSTIPVITLTTTSISAHLDYVGDIEAINNIEIRARVNGYLDKIHIDEGQEVREGQILFSINDEYYQNELRKAKAQLKLALAESKSMELEVQNTKLLADKGVVGKIEVEMAKAKLEAALARVDDAKAMEQSATINLSHATIRAPFSGVIDRIPYKVGSLIEEGKLLSTLSDIRAVNVYFNVSETEYLAFKKNNILSTENGQQVELILADGSTFNQVGKIETIEGEFESGTGSIAFRARFENPDKLLKHNATGKIRVQQKIENIFIIPQKSSFEIQEKNFVYVLQKDNTLKSVSFTPIRRYKENYIVRNGFENGNIIVYEGIQKLRDGMKINPKKETLISPIN